MVEVLHRLRLVDNLVLCTKRASMGQNAAPGALPRRAVFFECKKSIDDSVGCWGLTRSQFKLSRFIFLMAIVSPRGLQMARCTCTDAAVAQLPYGRHGARGGSFLARGANTFCPSACCGRVPDPPTHRGADATSAIIQQLIIVGSRGVLPARAARDQPGFAELSSVQRCPGPELHACAPCIWVLPGAPSSSPNGH